MIQSGLAPCAAALGRYFVSTLVVGLFIVVGLSDARTANAQQGVRLATLNPTQELSVIYGSLPTPLNADDVATYRQIFDLQNDGAWKKADQLIEGLRNDVLLGHVLAQRYLHPTAYRSRFVELKRWLDLYADHPQANQIYRLAKKRQPKDAGNPRQPIAGYLGGSGQELKTSEKVDYVSDKPRSQAVKQAVKRWQRAVRNLVERDRPTQARQLLRDDKIRSTLYQLEYDQALWIIAKGYFVNNKDNLAYQIAATAAARSGIHEPMINWTAGLAAFRGHRYDTAAGHFVRLVGSRMTADEDRAGAAFWAARSYLLAGKPQEVRRYLSIAADSSDGFYGILSQALLGKPIAFDWHVTGLKNDAVELLNRFPGSRRAIALGQVDEYDRAEHEIRKLAARAKPPLAQALVALAQKLDLPAAQMRVAQRLRMMDGRRHDGAMFPIPAWAKKSDIDIDPALLLAITRAESAFNKDAVSAAGARGLMQILPTTANDMSRRYRLDYQSKYQLHDPHTNVLFGAAYITWLNDSGLVGDSIIHLLMAYNGGPMRVKNWNMRFSHIDDDPILFLESIPISETRSYVKKVMANLWAYRARMELETPSLTTLAENSWPSYSSLEAQTGKFASAN